jgi:hypothetical protein
MKPTELEKQIKSRFDSYTIFIEAYNKAGGDLTHPVLSNQLSGARGLSKFSSAAYRFFFMWWDLRGK